MITIVNYGMGNLGSMLNMFKRIGVDACVESKPDRIKSASKLVLPGVGAFDAAMRCINENVGLNEALNYKALVEQVPILGICLGMQLLTRGSEEGEIPGLSWVDADVCRFPDDLDIKIPHMGWNIAIPGTSSKLTKDLPEKSRFYFVHSYYVTVDDPINSVMHTDHGVTFDSAIQCGNIFGVQFHPEKSHKFGMQLLKNFADL